MKRLTIISVLLIAFVQVNFAQKFPPLTNESITEYKNKDFDEARSLIDQSVKSVEGKSHSYTWHLRGHIYRHFYNMGIDEDLDNANREVAIKSFMKSIELDTEGTFKKANVDGLKPLTNSFWNEAVGVIHKREKANIHKAELSLDRFLKIRRSIDEMESMNQYLIDFFKAYASANRKLIEVERKNGKDITSYQNEFDRVEKSYMKVLELNPDDYIANYNLSINLYNEAAYRIEKMPTDADLGEIMLTQSGAIKIFEKALPHALKADNIRPGRVETVKALRAIYLALNNYEQFDIYDQMVKKIKSDTGVMGSVNREKFEQMRNDRKNFGRIQQSDDE
ncbi:MAG: tetratricopeptide (TPR) repeat protein [Patiriisocius sp.]|jgi:tetratricopeptide (TPR) repeat protein